MIIRWNESLLRSMGLHTLQAHPRKCLPLWVDDLQKQSRQKMKQGKDWIGKSVRQMDETEGRGWTKTPSEKGDELGRDRDGVRKENEVIQTWWVRKWWMGWKKDRWARSSSELCGREKERVGGRLLQTKDNDYDDDIETHSHNKVPGGSSPPLK